MLKYSGDVGQGPGNILPSTPKMRFELFDTDGFDRSALERFLVTGSREVEFLGRVSLDMPSGHSAL